MRVEVQLFGGLRAFVPSGRMTLEMDGGGALSAGALKKVAAAQLAAFVDSARSEAASDWVASSVVATDDRIFADDDQVPLSAALALLPPVNGG